MSEEKKELTNNSVAGEKEDKVLSLMGILKLDLFSITELNLSLTLKYIDKNVFISKNMDLIVKDPLNMQIHIIKKSLTINNIFLINEDLFESIYEQLLSNTEKNISVTEDTKEQEELDNTEISKLLYQVFYAAKIKGVSDIHILPKKEETVIKFRIDGKLDLYNSFPKNYCTVLVNKIKSESGMDQFISHLPQDGKLKKQIDNDPMEFRVSTCPTIYGEDVIMRVVNTDNLFSIGLEDLGFETEDLAIYRRNFIEPYGMIINVGSTGAGKTTTFYLTLNELFEYFPYKNICTVEDPVEIKFDKAVQIPINEAMGLTFPVVLKSLLRQDPDIILIGEMRDSATAEIGVRCALTGHLVFSTLHATDSFNAVTRLRDLDISDTLLSTTLSCILSQRLARKLCSCKEEFDIPKPIIDKYGLTFTKAFKSVGCPKCSNMGYKGRTAIIEVWELDEDYKNAIAFSEGEVKIKHLARKKNFQNLWKNGLKKVERGILSFEELESTVKPDKIINSVTYIREEDK